jgi:uncharacterized protein with NAD-binding domain and iron-sulfur cluster
VAILGGGAGGLSTAFALTATPELRERIEVTVHTLGWRLGGKGASGRNAALGQRIEEHGLHIWFGFYDNAFAMIRRCYDELGRPPDAPLATWTDAFKPLDQCVQFEPFDGEWVAHHFRLPRNPLVPGDRHPHGLWDVATVALGWLQREWERVRGEHARAVAAAAARSTPEVDHQHVRTLAEECRLDFRHWTETPALHLLELAHRIASRRPSNAMLGTIARLLSATRDWLWAHVVRERVEDKRLRMFFLWLDLSATISTGIHRDELVERGFGAINDEEFRDWLRRHGANELTLSGSPLVRAIYDAAFCFEHGDTARGNVAAGKAAQDFIRSVFLYKGALMWKMQAGMGDTVFSPLYEVLRARGVRFEFFRAVSRLGVSGREIDAIDVIPQAIVKGDYQPLVDVNGLPCWPSEPDWAQLEDGEALRARGVNFEQEYNPAGRSPLTLRRGEDFDWAVLAIPVGALPPLCGELAAADQRFARMLDSASTVATQAFQLWLSADPEQLGSSWSSGTLASCYAEPLDTYCDMSQVLPREAWPTDMEVKMIAYFCGVLPESDAARGDAAVREAALGYLRETVKGIWPQFDWALLADPQGRKGHARFDAQYWRANVSGSERYALTPAGSVEHRLWPHDSGFDNLALAGDWTRNGIDGGSVEAAVTSGLLAAEAIDGIRRVVPGTDGWLESDRDRVTA